jgi:hypothetical protein
MADLPRRGFQFPDLRLKSTRRLDERRMLGEILKFFLKSSRGSTASRLGNFYQPVSKTNPKRQ